MELCTTEKLTLTVKQFESKFNEEWRLSVVEQILKRYCSHDDKTPQKPVIRKDWLNIIPKDAYPPFEFIVDE